MKKNFQPFEVIFGLKTPMQTTPYPIMLDGLLFYTIEQLHRIEDDKDRVLKILDTLLDTDEGIYKASSGILVRNEVQSITTGMASHPTCLDWEDYPFAYQKRTVLITKGGKYRKRLTKYATIAPLAVRFYGVGDIEQLRFYLESVFGLGRSYSQGYGEVGSLIINPIDQDQSWLGDVTGVKTLHRHLPVSLVETYDMNVDKNTLEVAVCNVHAPYHLDSNAWCYRTAKPLIVIDNNY